MDVHLQKLAAAQADVVAVWQLVALGWTRRRIERHAEAGAWVPVHQGVFALTQAPLTQRQIWIAATLTEPGTALTHESARCCWGFSDRPCPVPTVTRSGSGGPRHLDGVRVHRSILLVDDVTRNEGIWTTTVERTIVDMAARQSRAATARDYREASRLELVTPRSMVAALQRHRGRRGTRLLWDLAERYSGLPYSRTRSNAEARALEILQDADLLPDLVNVRIAGEEADLIWLDRRLIVEIDGPQYHRFKDEDDRKEVVWEAAGYVVRRIPSGDVYTDPDALLSRLRR